MSNTPLTDDVVLQVPSSVLARKAAGETVLLNLADEQYYSLTGVGTRLWELVESGTPFGRMIDVLVDEFEVERQTLAADLRSVVVDLVGTGLLVIDLA